MAVINFLPNVENFSFKENALMHCIPPWLSFATRKCILCRVPKLEAEACLISCSVIYRYTDIITRDKVIWFSAKIIVFVFFYFSMKMYCCTQCCGYLLEVPQCYWYSLEVPQYPLVLCVLIRSASLLWVLIRSASVLWVLIRSAFVLKCLSIVGTH